MEIPIEGGSSQLQSAIRAAVSRYPSWLVRAARLTKFVITDRPDVKAQVAMFEHGSRNLYVWPGIGDLLQKAVGHELAHACDDVFDMPHYFTSVAEWQRIHRNQQHFDIPKYRDEPLEYFADCVTKLFLLGPARMSTTQPDEARFILSWVFPVLQKEFGT
jgi:hypothetical protein